MSDNKKVVDVSADRLAEIRKAAETKDSTYDVVDYKREAGYKYRFVNTKNGKDLKNLKLGYEYVTDDKGQRVSVNAGSGEIQVLQRIPDAYSQVLEDVKQKKINETEAALNPKLAAELGIGQLDIDSQIREFKKRIKT